MLKKLMASVEKVKAARLKAQEEAKKVLKPALQDFMASHPNIKAVGWAQYTPYFNDGEPCVFGLRGVHASATDERSDSFYDEEGWTEIYGAPRQGFTEKDWKDLGQLEKTLGDIEDELEAVFGDHVRVIVTKDGVDVEEYEHD